MLLSAAKELFYVSRKSQGIKPATIRNYRAAIDRLIAVVGDKPVDKYTRGDVDQLVTTLAEGGMANSTINKMVDGLAALYHWAAWDERLQVARSPIQGRRRLPIHKRERLRIPAEEFGSLIAAAPHPRDRILVAFGLMTMLRQSEILTLRISDLDMHEYVLNARIHKTNGLDRMKIAHELRPYIREWLTFYTQEVGPLHPDYYLIPSKSAPTHGDRLQPTKPMSQVARIINSILDEAGYPTRDSEGKSLREGAHTLRRSGALAFFRAQSQNGGIDDALRLSSSMLHHKSSSTTENYLGLKSETERRNKILDQGPMFPGLAGENVHNLRGEDHGGHQEKAM